MSHLEENITFYFRLFLLCLTVSWLASFPQSKFSLWLSHVILFLGLPLGTWYTLGSEMPAPSPTYSSRQHHQLLCNPAICRLASQAFWSLSLFINEQMTHRSSIWISFRIVMNLLYREERGFSLQNQEGLKTALFQTITAVFCGRSLINRGKILKKAKYGESSRN